MKPSFSRVLVVVFWVGLALSLVNAVAVTSSLLSEDSGFRFQYGPEPVMLGLTYLLPLVIGWRIWVHRRERHRALDRALAALEAEMEEKNV